MKKSTRSLIFYSFVIFFIISTPIVLLYAKGYNFDWQKKKLILTGGIYLDSKPQKAQIFLNGKPIDQKTPALVKRLLPKKYEIKVSKAGFYPWEKYLIVKSQLITEAKNILLVPKSPQINLIKTNLDKNFSFKKFLNLTTKNNLFKQNKKLSKNIVSFFVLDKTIFYLEKPNYFLYKANYDIENKQQLSLLPFPDKQYLSHPQMFVSDNQQVVVINDKNELYLFNYQNKIFQKIATNVQGIEFSKDNKKLLYYTKNEISIYWLADNPETQTKAGTKELIVRLGKKIQQTVWYAKTDQHIIFLGDGQIKIVEIDGRGGRNIHDLIKKGVSEIFYSRENNKLYFIKDNNLYNCLITK